MEAEAAEEASRSGISHEVPSVVRRLAWNLGNPDAWPSKSMHKGAEPQFSEFLNLTRHLQVARALLADHIQQNGGLETLLRGDGMVLSRVWFRERNESENACGPLSAA